MSKPASVAWNQSILFIAASWLQLVDEFRSQLLLCFVILSVVVLNTVFPFWHVTSQLSYNTVNKRLLRLLCQRRLNQVYFGFVRYSCFGFLCLSIVDLLCQYYSQMIGWKNSFL